MLPFNWLDLPLSAIASIAPMQEVALPIFEAKRLSVFFKREDLLHPLVGGNKVYKLYKHFQRSRERDAPKKLATFGGAYSNHLLALACLGNMQGLQTIGVVRGERPKQLSPTLDDAQRLGMQLHFVSRSQYRRRTEPEFLQSLNRQFGDVYWIPKGGGGQEGIVGSMAMAEGILATSAESPDYVFHACGTATSLAGLVKGFNLAGATQVKCCGVSVLNAGDQHRKVVSDAAPTSNKWQVLDEFHAGGYARYPDTLANFVNYFESQTQVLLDPVYTAKVMHAIVCLAERDYFPVNARVVVVHSGGLQGRRGFGLSHTLGEKL